MIYYFQVERFVNINLHPSKSDSVTVLGTGKDEVLGLRGGVLQDEQIRQNNMSDLNKIFLIFESNFSNFDFCPVVEHVFFEGSITLGPFENTLRGRDSPQLDRKVLHKAGIRQLPDNFSNVHFLINCSQVVPCQIFHFLF